MIIVGCRHFLATLLPFKVTVVSDCCDGNPDLQVPADYNGCPGSSTEPENTGMATGTIVGNNCGNPDITFNDAVMQDSDCKLVIQRTWIATNPNFTNKTATAVQTISLEDDTAPVISGCPADIIVSSNADCIAIVDFIPPTADDNCGLLSFVNDRPTGSGSRFTIGTTTITYVAIDNCGNESSCSFDVTVLSACCQDELIITCPADYVGCPGTSIDPSVTGMASANSSADCPADISFFDEVTTLSGCAGAQVIRRHWVVQKTGTSDADTCIQTITLADNDAPVIVSCVPDVVLDFEDRTYSWADPTVTDQCETQITYSTAPGTTFAPGVTTVIVTVTDACGQITTCQFTVSVRQDPSSGTGAGIVVNCPSDLQVSCTDDLSGRVPLPQIDTDCDLCDADQIPGFVFMGEFGGHKYYCSRDRLTWQNAAAVCRANGGQLAIIDNAEENKFLAQTLQANSAYIGLSDHKREGTFTWLDGSPLSYSNWYPRQPNDYFNNQDFVELLRNGLWNDQYNSKRLEFIMELSCLNVEQTGGPTQLSQIGSSSTVSFRITDACGNSTNCSYNIIVDNATSFSCSDDIVTTTASDQEVVYFDPPSFRTCCDQCSHGGSIPGFVFMGERNGSFYYCSKTRDTWHNGNLEARKIGGSLAIIDDYEENLFVSSKLGNIIGWVGISDHAEEGRWRTVNGVDQEFFNWRFDNPNNHEGIQHYVELEPSGYWNDNSGTFLREYIVEIQGCGRVRQVAGLPSGAFFPKGNTTIAFDAADNCGISNSCSFNVRVNGQNSGQSARCNSFSNNSRRAFIHRVQINNFVNTSGDNGGYLDFKYECPTLYAGSNLNLVVTPGWSSFRYFAFYSIYVDWNGDGDFIDNGEYVGRSRSSNTVAGKIKVPSNARTSQTTMRIVMSLTGYPDPCGDYHFGETEDYCLSIIGDGAIVDPEETGTFKSDDQSIVEMTDKPSLDINLKPAIYPNPANDYFMVSDPSIIRQLTVYSVDGRVAKQVRRPNQRIDISDLPSGLYLVRMIDEDGLEINDKLIVN